LAAWLLAEADTPSSTEADSSNPPPDAVSVTDNRELQRYEIRLDDQLAGFATYRLRPGRITFVHTEVEPESEGRGIGSLLARAVLDDARARGLSVIPICPFISSWIKRHPAYADLVPARPATAED
jgi:predicted GNAT family acetyltransferase